MGRWWAILAVLLGGVAAAGALDVGAALRERYPGPDGQPSEMAYRQAEGIAPLPGSEQYRWEATFKLTYRQQDRLRLEQAQPIATDCYLVRTHSYRAPYRALPVWDGRVYQQGDRLLVAAYTRRCEQVVGEVGEEGIKLKPGLQAEEVPLAGHRDLRYHPFTGQLWRRGEGSEISERQAFFLPLPVLEASGRPLVAEYRIEQTAPGRFALVVGRGGRSLVLATCRAAAPSLVGESPGYSPGLGPGCTMLTGEPTVVLEIRGELTAAVRAEGDRLVLGEELPPAPGSGPSIRVDGDFSDWRSLPGMGDPAGDLPGYLQYSPDTDLLELKVASDQRYLYCYTRVAGRHGNTGPGDDRFYYYIYIDADRNPATGYLPTRDDDCYYGVAIGDDCEAQYEFVGGRFVKTFFGFTGVGAEKEALAGRVRLGPSWYGKHDQRGRLRDRYKVEYVQHGGKRAITEDYTPGTSDDIVIALSPDGSECELRVELAGFLRDQAGRQVIAPGQRIDLAVGMEASAQVRGNTRWSADSTAPVRGYRVGGR